MIFQLLVKFLNGEFVLHKKEKGTERLLIKKKTRHICKCATVYWLTEEKDQLQSELLRIKAGGKKVEEKIWSGKGRFEQERGMNKGMKCSLDRLSENAAA